MKQCHRAKWILAICCMAFLCGQAVGQGVQASGGICKPASQRTQEIGCWILADDSMGSLAKSSLFWHLDTYPTQAAANAEKGQRGVVLAAFGKYWLMTIEDEDWRPAHGDRVTAIGPLQIVAGKEYSAQYMEAVFTPGMTAPTHIHSGPEAWYTLSGETCLETSDGRVQMGRAGGPPVIVGSGLSMHLTATGAEQRHALVLILHETSQPATTPVHDWIPKGLCKRNK